MNAILEYVVLRPLAACIQGTVIGLYLPLTLAGLLAAKAGRVWAIMLTPLWLMLAALALPLSIIYCFVMVMAKGTLWQYPPEQRGRRMDWAEPPSGTRRDGL